MTSDRRRLRAFFDRELTSGTVVLWDFDGVVSDTEPLQDASYRQLAHLRGVTLPDEYFLPLVGQTEDTIWEALGVLGVPVPDDAAGRAELRRERAELISEWGVSRLHPSWLAVEWFPELRERGARQYVVSNGDPDFIASLLSRWGLAEFVEVARRSEGTTKENNFRRLCVPPAVVVEDNDDWLALARRLGAATIGVRHGYNEAASLDADLLVQLS